eukprot:1637713-Rhodomonas_salina.1
MRRKRSRGSCSRGGAMGLGGRRAGTRRSGEGERSGSDAWREGESSRKGGGEEGGGGKGAERDTASPLDPAASAIPTAPVSEELHQISLEPVLDRAIIGYRLPDLEPAPGRFDVESETWHTENFERGGTISLLKPSAYGLEQCSKPERHLVGFLSKFYENSHAAVIIPRMGKASAPHQPLTWRRTQAF